MSSFLKRPMPPHDERLRTEFNRWAEEGMGTQMERSHASITAKTLERMHLRLGDRVLDLGCGDGWASRLLARMVAAPEAATPAGQVVGLDISDAMIRRARTSHAAIENLLFVWGAADHIPWAENFFTHVFSVESFYYYPDQEKVLAELFRVVAPLGEIFLVIALHRDNPGALRWLDHIKVPVHVRSAAEYETMLRDGGWLDVSSEQYAPEGPPAQLAPDDPHHTPTGEDPHERALLIRARKPDLTVPARGIEVWA